MHILLIEMPHNATMNLMTRLLNDTVLPYDSNIYCFSARQNGMIEIYDAYKIESHLPPTLKIFSTWSPDKGMMVLDSNIWSRRS